MKGSYRGLKQQLDRLPWEVRRVRMRIWKAVFRDQCGICGFHIAGDYILHTIICVCKVSGEHC